ncbi:axin interactor [Thecamonas trahens ATCC 50062]|uniref:Axin interactor n=1 Tax=Thecamonas trahens ATCC 50062 TaxID=461836 RepID=A0A0L0DFN7_THETB|nr:axin interactor [Thecamonas trahens ATCC 50062]KNC51050.1 axin interactor [Thecamonas trahens ATCC 50062]|eukprot:XP_013756514.1 axin interactor [Thecamonas trahens ATCC 50062]
MDARQALLEAKAKWSQRLHKAVEADAWGQVVEAAEGYAVAGKRIVRMQDAACVDVLSRAVLGKIYLCVQMRIKALGTDPTDAGGSGGGGEASIEGEFPLAEMQVLDVYVSGLFANGPIRPGDDGFPVDIAAYEAQRVAADGSRVASRPVKRAEAPAGGFLLPPPAPFPGGGTQVSIYLDRIGFADAESYLEPRITITVVDGRGKLLESAQETPVAVRKDASYVYFGARFKHYKPKKAKLSTRAFCLLEPDELGADGEELLLEIYKKPADFKRKKKLKLFSDAPLFLHVRLTQRRDS